MIDTLIKLYDDFAKGSRVKDLAQLAGEYQFGFQKRVVFEGQRLELKSFKAFSVKGAKRMLGVLTQNSELFNGELRFFDFLYTKDLETKTTSVIEINCRDILTNYVLIEPKSTFSKMKGFFVSEKKLYPELSSFHQQFQISSKEEYGENWLNKKALSSMTDFPGIYIEAQGNSFIFYYRKKEIQTPEILPLIEFAEEFVRLSCFDHSGEFV